MKKIKCELHGIAPIILHSCQCANPLHPLSLAMKKITSKRNKTEEDLIKLSDLEWEGGLYWNDDIGVCFPGENIEAAIREAGKSKKLGKQFQKGFVCEDMMIPLDYGENLTKEQLMSDMRFRDVRPMKVKQSRVIRTRPRFNMWNLTFTAMYDENVLDLDDVVNAFEYAGQYVGLADSRPKYGKFSARITELN